MPDPTVPMESRRPSRWRWVTIVAASVLVAGCSWSGNGDEAQGARSTTTSTTPATTEHVVTPQVDYLAVRGQVTELSASELELEGPTDQPLKVAVLVFPLAPTAPSCVVSAEIRIATLRGAQHQLTAYPPIPSAAAPSADGDEAGWNGVLLLGNRPRAAAAFSPGRVSSLDVTRLYHAWTTNDWPGGTTGWVEPGTPFSVAVRPANVSDRTDLVLASSESTRPPELRYRTRTDCA